MNVPASNLMLPKQFRHISPTVNDINRTFTPPGDNRLAQQELYSQPVIPIEHMFVPKPGLTQEETQAQYPSHNQVTGLEQSPVVANSQTGCCVEMGRLLAIGLPLVVVANAFALFSKSPKTVSATSVAFTSFVADVSMVVAANAHKNAANTLNVSNGRFPIGYTKAFVDAHLSTSKGIIQVLVGLGMIVGDSYVGYAHYGDRPTSMSAFLHGGQGVLEGLFGGAALALLGLTTMGAVALSRWSRATNDPSIGVGDLPRFTFNELRLNGPQRFGDEGVTMHEGRMVLDVKVGEHGFARTLGFWLLAAGYSGGVINSILAVYDQSEHLTNRLIDHQDQMGEGYWALVAGLGVCGLGILAAAIHGFVHRNDSTMTESAFQFANTSLTHLGPTMHHRRIEEVVDSPQNGRREKRNFSLSPGDFHNSTTVSPRSDSDGYVDVDLNYSAASRKHASAQRRYFPKK